MASGVQSWSKTAATNASSDSAINWAEGQAPSSVNDSARAMMASTAKYRDDVNGSITTGGTSTAFTATSNQSFASESAMDGARLALKFSATSGASPTLAVDSLTARALQTASGTAIPTGVILSGSIWDVTFVNSIPAWIVHGIPSALPSGITLPSNSVVTATITDANVTLAKLESRTANTLLGRYTASTGVPQEVTVSTGLVLNTSTGYLTAPAVPIPGGFKNLSIKVASNTTVTVAADFVTTTDSTNYQSTALSGTINLATNGSANTLDTGSIAIDTWYFIWAIAKADGTTAGLASTSSTAPTLPTGYTYKARIGAVKTIHASATLYGTWQLGRRVQYVVGLAQTSVTPNIVNGSSGTYSATAPTYVATSVAGGNVQSSVVPTTASEIIVIAWNNYNNSVPSTCLVAPNTSYAGSQSTNPPPICVNSSTNAIVATGSMILESTSIAIVSGTTGGVNCLGWVDNI